MNNRFVVIRNDYVEKIRCLQAGFIFAWLQNIVQCEGFSGSIDEAIKAIKHRVEESGDYLSDEEIREKLDYLFSLDVVQS